MPVCGAEWESFIIPHLRYGGFPDGSVVRTHLPMEEMQV